MTNNEAVDAVVAWVVEHLPVLTDNTYNYVPAGKAKELPDVIGDLAGESIRQDDPDFPLTGLQQVAIRRFDIGLSFMVESGADEEGAAEATGQLRAQVETLAMALLQDSTLGGRVDLASPFVFEADYTPPFVEYEDGTRGREATVHLAIAERIHVED